MKQSRLASLLETSLSTAAGFGVAVTLQATILPALGVPIELGANLGFAGVMTVVSIARQYLMRRLFEALHLRVPLSPALLAIAAERRRQIEVEGWSAEHDDEYKPGTLALAGSSYAESAVAWLRARGAADTIKKHPAPMWPWSYEWWKPESARRDLVKAGALLVAELDALERRRKAAQWTRGELLTFPHNRAPMIINKTVRNDSNKQNESRSLPRPGTGE